MGDPAIMRDFERDTLWRQAPLCHWEERISDKGPCINGIFSAPGSTRDCCFMDWLHGVDPHTKKVKFGMLFGLDFLGNLFWHTWPKLASTKKAGIAAIFQEVRQWYQDNGVANRFLTLQDPMILKNATSSPKMRSKEAEARALAFAVWPSSM